MLGVSGWQQSARLTFDVTPSSPTGAAECEWMQRRNLARVPVSPLTAPPPYTAFESRQNSLFACKRPRIDDALRELHLWFHERSACTPSFLP